jgi:hypothetical protein
VSVTTPSTWEVPLSTATAFLVALATTSALAAGGASGGGHEAERVERAGRGRSLEEWRWLRGGGGEEDALGGHGGAEELLRGWWWRLAIRWARAARLYYTLPRPCLALEAYQGHRWLIIIVRHYRFVLSWLGHSASPEASQFCSSETFFSVRVFRFPRDRVILDGTFARCCKTN